MMKSLRISNPWWRLLRGVTPCLTAGLLARNDGCAFNVIAKSIATQSDASGRSNLPAAFREMVEIASRHHAAYRLAYWLAMTGVLSTSLRGALRRKATQADEAISRPLFERWWRLLRGVTPCLTAGLLARNDGV